jgi:hypothetical protein
MRRLFFRPSEDARSAEFTSPPITARASDQRVVVGERHGIDSPGVPGQQDQLLARGGFPKSQPNHLVLMYRTTSHGHEQRITGKGQSAYPGHFVVGGMGDAAGSGSGLCGARKIATPTHKVRRAAGPLS